MTSSRQRLGQQAEQLVADHLQRRGFSIVGRNVRVGRLELDIIAERDRLLAICEVRSRSTAAFGAPVSTIDREKVRRIRRAAAQWLSARTPRTRYFDYSDIRFDAASVTFFANGDHELHYFAGAF